MFTTIFWKDAGERALKTFAQTAVAMVTASSMSFMTMDITNILMVSLMAAVVSLFTSIASTTVGSGTSASLVVDTKEQAATSAAAAEEEVTAE